MSIVQELKCQSCFAPLEVRRQMGNIVLCEYCGTENVLYSSVRRVVADYSHDFAVALVYAISDSFSSLDDIADLIVMASGLMHLNSYNRLTYDTIAGNSARSKARELVMWCQRRVVLQELVDACLTLRPNIDI